MKRGPDAATLVARALLAGAARVRCTVALSAIESTPWASATFAGARHCLTLTGPAGAALDDWLAALPEADLPIAGHLVADVVVVEVTRAGDTTMAAIEALTVEER